MSLGHGSQIVRSGLVLHLDAANPKSYPGTGTTWYDLSGNNNNASMYNGLLWNNQGYMVFDGIDDYAQISYNSSSMSGWNTEQTIGFWMNHNISTNRRNLWDQAYGGFGTWTHEYGGGINYFYGNSGTNNTPYTSLVSANVTKNIWVYMCVTRNTTSVKWYKNGVLTGTTSNPYGVLTNTTANIRIGLGYTGVPWQGNISIIHANSVALSGENILQNYNATKSRFNL